MSIMILAIISYIHSCFHILFVSIIADLLLRLFKVIGEHVYYQKHYLPESRLSTIFKRAFTYNSHTKIFIAVVILIPLVTTWIPMPPSMFYRFMPLYWLWSFTKANHSLLDYAYWIRESCGLDYGEGMAANYFNGYLKLTLPSHKDGPGMRERMEMYENAHNVKFAVKRLIILVSNTMFVGGKLKSNCLHEATPLETIVKLRAGVKRPFRIAVYKFNLDNKTYYVAAEGATPLVSFFDSLHFRLTSTPQMHEMQREILLKFYKTIKNLLRDWPETRDEAEVVFYNTKTVNGQQQDIGEVLIAHIQNLWLREGKND